MSLLTDFEIKEALARKEIVIENFDEEKCLQPASYDMRVGRRAIISRSRTLEEFKEKISEECPKEIDLEKEGSITIPAGAFCLITTYEKVRFSKRYAGHIGVRSYYTRKGLALLSGLQIDRGFEGVLVLGICNISPKSFALDYQDPFCTIEIHRLEREVEKPFPESKMTDQKDGKIPRGDKDYLRIIETMSISDMTEAIVMLSTNINKLTSHVKILWFLIPLMTALLVVIISALLQR